LDGDRARARHFGLLGGDELRAQGLASNLLTTPGRGISARTLTPVDSAVMVLDAAKSIEDPQAIRGLPIAQRADQHFVSFAGVLLD
jgi:peptide subunit release factor RF-3